MTSWKLPQLHTSTDLQDLNFRGGICDLDADILGLAFLPGTSCFLASDSDGEVVLWVAHPRVDMDNSGRMVLATTGTTRADPGTEAQYLRQHTDNEGRLNGSTPAGDRGENVVGDGETVVGGMRGASEGGKRGDRGSDDRRRSASEGHTVVADSVGNVGTAGVT